MLMVPIFHVHGENPESVIHVTKLACDYRMEFGKDVVIDLVCYRRYGHNEGDEPYFTQPQMYERIRERPPLYKIYGAQLLAENIVSEDEIKDIASGINERSGGVLYHHARKTVRPSQGLTIMKTGMTYMESIPIKC